METLRLKITGHLLGISQEKQQLLITLRLNFKKITDELLWHFIRKPNLRELLRVVNFPLSELNNIPNYQDSKTYQEGDRVSFKFKVYEAKNQTTGNQPVVDNAVDSNWKELDFVTSVNLNKETLYIQTWNSSKIYLEHFLNSRFNNNSADPYSNTTYLDGSNKIYLEFIKTRDEVYVFSKTENESPYYVYREWHPQDNESWDTNEYAGRAESGQGNRIYKSEVDNNTDDPLNSNNWIIDIGLDNFLYLFRKSEVLGNTRYIIWTPTAVLNSVSKAKIRDEVNRYNHAGIKYEIKEY